MEEETVIELLKVFAENIIEYVEDHSRKNGSGQFTIDSENLCKEVNRLYRMSVNKNIKENL